jgi:Uncharacterized protein conserved in bacteria (DUF2252)
MFAISEAIKFISRFGVLCDTGRSNRDPIHDQGVTSSFQIQPVLEVHMGRKIANINEATLDYEAWLSRVAGPLVPTALEEKHQRMRLPEANQKASAFVFLRASFYRFAQRWPLDFPDLNDAPIVPSVGDAHLENFGTWLDARKRLIWGINDFDEAFSLPFTFDLLRLATSVAVGDLDLEVTCDAILRGYRARLEGQRGLQHKFVVERWPEFSSAIAASLPSDPGPYWSKYRPEDQRIASFDHLPKKLLEALQESVPKRLRNLEQAFTRQAGTGSLGRYRLAVSMATDGRKQFFGIEAKRAAPSACIWANLGTGRDNGTKASRLVLEHAQHIADPGLRFGKDWVIRRLDPRRQRFSLADIPKPHEKLIEAMGVETANIHLGDPKAAKRILKDLDARGGDWLPRAARQAAEHLRADQKAFTLGG